MVWLRAKRWPVVVRDGEGGPIKRVGDGPVWFDRLDPLSFACDLDLEVAEVAPPVVTNPAWAAPSPSIASLLAASAVAPSADAAPAKRKRGRPRKIRTE